MLRPLKQRSLTVAVASAIFVLTGLSACSKTETSASLMTEAQQYAQKGDLKAALIQAKNAVAKSPQDGEARLLLSKLYMDASDPVSAEKEIRKAIALAIGAERTAPILGKSLMAQGQAQKALDALTPALASHSAPLLAIRGDASLMLGDSAGAKQAYEQALALQPNSGGALIGMGRYSMMVQKDPAAAERYLAEAVAKDPNNADAWDFKAVLARSQAKPDDALAAYSQVLKLKPGHRTAHIEKAQIEIGQGKLDLAKADLAAARKNYPGDLFLSYTQALLDFNEGKYAPANNALQKILGVAPDHMPSVLLAGAVELNLGATQQAEQHLRKYLQAFPDNVYARKLLAKSLLQSAQPGEAVAVLAPALKGPSSDAQLMGLAGESYLKTKDFGKSTAYFEQASALAPKMAGLHTALGLSKLAEGDQATGMSELELGASLDSANADAGLTLVRTQLGLKHYDKALAAAEALEKQRPTDPQAQAAKGTVYLAKGDRSKARASFEKALALKPDYFAATAFLANLDVSDNKLQDAQHRFEALLAKDKKHIGAMTAMAELAIAQNHPQEALGWFEKASSENPDALAPALKLATVYLRLNQPQKALSLLRKFQTANTANPALLDLLGQAQLVSKDPAAALETYSKLVKVAPTSAPAQVRLATVHKMLNNDAAAADDLKRAVALDPNLLMARLGQVQLAMQNNKPDEALAIARTLQTQRVNAGAGYELEARLQLIRKQPAQALAALEKSFAIEKSPQLLIKIAGVMRLAGKAKDIEPRLLQWQTANPNDALVPMYLAEVSLAEKRYKVAIERFEAIVKQQPKNAAALNNLAWAYQQEKDPRAVATAEQALQAAPGNASVMDTLGWMLVEQGNTARALPLLQKAAGLAPASAEIRYHLAVALSKSGDKLNARKELDKLLADNKSFPQIDDAKALLKTL